MTAPTPFEVLCEMADERCLQVLLFASKHISTNAPAGEEYRDLDLIGVVTPDKHAAIVSEPIVHGLDVTAAVLIERLRRAVTEGAA